MENAYSALWDSIEDNEDILSDEVWIWRDEDRQFKHATLGTLPPPPGVGCVAESDVVQL